jgi:hypothetical protein
MRTMIWACVAALLLGCATTPMPVPVAGEVAALAGEWLGNYDGDESRRSGSIVFTLTAGRDTAYGDVLMVPVGAMQALRPLHPSTPEIDDRSSPQMLTISFVRVRDGWVSGTLDPYRSPDCACTLVTTFTGHLNGDRITGTFVTRHEDGHFETGSWSVRRKR